VELKTVTSLADYINALNKEWKAIETKFDNPFFRLVIIYLGQTGIPVWVVKTERLPKTINFSFEINGQKVYVADANTWFQDVDPEAYKKAYLEIFTPVKDEILENFEQHTKCNQQQADSTSFSQELKGVEHFIAGLALFAQADDSSLHMMQEDYDQQLVDTCRQYGISELVLGNSKEWYNGWIVPLGENSIFNLEGVVEIISLDTVCINC
jgi:hypothetical protein